MPDSSSLGPDWDIPKDLTRAGRKAAEALRDFCIQHDLTHTGGCRVFYSPEEWRARGEAHATSSLLVIVYDGAACRRALSFDGGDYRTLEAFRLILDSLDVFSEECTCWYSGIYNA
jgi:hypothetical protein